MSSNAICVPNSINNLNLSYSRGKHGKDESETLHGVWRG